MCPYFVQQWAPTSDAMHSAGFKPSKTSYAIKKEMDLLDLKQTDMFFCWINITFVFLQDNSKEHL